MLFPSGAFLAAALLATVAAASPVPDTHVVHEERDVGGPGRAWEKRDRVPPRAVLPMRVGLTQRNLDQGADWLMDVSHPSSPNFGKHWTSEQVTTAFQPSDEAVQTVADWLVTAGGIAPGRIGHSANKAWLAFDATAAEAEALLHAEFYEFEHAAKGHSMVAADRYHVPEAIQAHIDYITPGVKGARISGPASVSRKRTSEKKKTRHPNKKARRHLKSLSEAAKTRAAHINATDVSNCDTVITPACIRALYNIPVANASAAVSGNNSLGIFEEGDYYAQQDLNAFFAAYSPAVPNGTHPIPNFIDGAEAPVTDDEDAGGESDLDFMLAYPIVYPQTVTLFQTDDAYYADGYSGTSGIFNTFLDALDGSYCTYSAYGETGDDATLDPTYPDTKGGADAYTGTLMCGTYTPTNVISISYGEQESDLPAYYQRRQCDEFLKLGLQGVSIVVASGDTGVAGYEGDPNPDGCLGTQGNVFSPTQPNSCPWLTNVGATTISTGNSVSDPEVAVADPDEDYYSGGGFSNLFVAPAYQTSAIATYFASAAAPTYAYYYNGSYNATANGGVYNRNGRGIPDVAANGDNILGVYAGELGTEGGTSASAPIFASILNRIVEARIAAGKGAVGFVNPTLYANPGVLNDIVSGSNPGCGTDGFAAGTGWDPVTGLGTPNYPKMLELFLSLP